MPRCFVMQPFDGAEFDRRYDEIYKEAIEQAGFEPYRVDRDRSAAIPITYIENGIKASAACFADISIDNPNVWFELGFAICANKPLCLICSSERPRFPFDIQHRQIIRYRTASPSDFSDLKNAIIERLQAIQEKDLSIESIIKKALPEERGKLSDMEFSALCIVFEDEDLNSLSMESIINAMERQGYTKIAAKVALTRLEQEGLVESQEVSYEMHDGYFRAYQTTSEGKQHILTNMSRIQLRNDSSTSRFGRVTRASRVSEMIDDDIPF